MNFKYFTPSLLPDKIMATEQMAALEHNIAALDSALHFECIAALWLQYYKLRLVTYTTTPTAIYLPASIPTITVHILVSASLLTANGNIKI